MRFRRRRRKPARSVRAHLKDAIVVGGTNRRAGRHAGEDSHRRRVGAPTLATSTDSSTSSSSRSRSRRTRASAARTRRASRAATSLPVTNRPSPRKTRSTIMFIPYHFLYHIFRKGKNFVLRAGSEIPARTEATLTAHAQRHARDRNAASARRRTCKCPNRRFRSSRSRRRSAPSASKSRKTPAPVPTRSPHPQ